MNEIRFFVAGIPRPGGSKRVFPIRKGGVLTGRFVVTDDAGKGNKDWRASVAHEGKEAMRTPQRNRIGQATGIVEKSPIMGPVEIELHFVMPRPKAHFGTGVWSDRLKPNSPLHHVNKPDAGKLARSTIDALTSILWRDDAQIVRETHSKAYGSRPGVTVIVREATGNGGTD